MNKTTIGIAMGTAALGMAIGYLSGQSRSTVACSPTAPLYQHVKESPAKDVVQQEAPAKDEQVFASGPIKDAKIDFGQAVPHVAEVKHKPVPPHPVQISLVGRVIQKDGHDCAWVHAAGGAWKADSLIHFGQSQIFATYEQAVDQTRERWCGK